MRVRVAISRCGRLHEGKGSNKPMITESQESKSISQAKRLVMQRLNYNEQEADEFIRVKLRNDIPVLRTPQGGKFILGAARMFCDGELRTANDIGSLNSTLKLVASDAHINEYDRNLNGMSFQDLVQRFAKAMSDNLEAEKAEVGKMVFDTPSDYEIVRIDSFDQASEYGEYTDWCVTHFENMFDSYTSDGINQFYFCLRNGFKGVKRRTSEGCPLDEYGLSMIAVSVNENGMLNTCTCRWNHTNGGDDNVMNTKELSQVIGMNFFEVFKPNNKWKSLVSDAIQRLKNGESPDSVFDDCWPFYDGFASVELYGKRNFINERYNLLSDQWFDYCDEFREGFARVKLNEKWNHIDKQGNYLSDQWFDDCSVFHEGFAAIKLNDEWNFIDEQGNLLSDQWFDDCDCFYEGFAAIKLNDRMNFIDEQGNYLSDQWFYWCGDFYEGFAVVYINDKRYKIDTNGRLHENRDNRNLNIIKESNTFEEWFGNSVLRDENGKPIKMYHGTDSEFNAFSKDFIGRNGSYEGYGFNFTPFISRAQSYNSKNVIEAYLRVNNPMTTVSNKITLGLLKKVISYIDSGKPFSDTIVAAFENARYNEKWDVRYYKRALPIAAKKIYDYNIENEYGDAGIYADICLNGNGNVKKTIEAFEKIGFDSAIFYDDDGRINTVVVFEPNQIKRTSNKTFTNDIDSMNENVMLIESQESKSISQAKRLVMQKLNYNEQEADEFIRVKLRNDIPVLRTPSGGKFILGAARMFCDGELRTANDIGNLNSTLKLVASDAHINEYDKNLNDMSYQDLIQRFAKAMSDNLEAEKAEVDSMVFDTPSDYEIVRIDSFEQASEYGRYTSWCVTHDRKMFDSYTSDGINQFYFCLKHGFEGVEERASEGCPLDEYGLSMIAVSVNENGMLNTCTCRWNHDNGGDDNVMNTKELSQVIGMNFFEVFKPNNKWKSMLSDAIQRLKNGESPRSVFDCHIKFREGFATVKFNGRWNYIDEQYNFLSSQWFDSCWSFHEGFGAVELNHKNNFIDMQGNILSRQWFDECNNFYDGFAAVELNDEWNYIDKQGRLLSDQWFDRCYNFYDGFAVVYLNDKYNFINKQCNILSDQWFDYCWSFNEGFARVNLNNKFNFINEQGNLLSDQWFDKCWEFKEGLADVILNGKWNWIDEQGKLLSDTWFDSCSKFSEGFAAVRLNDKYNHIDKQGRFLSRQWFDWCGDFREGFASVKLNGEYYDIDTSGRITSKHKQGNYPSGQGFDDNSGFKWFRFR